MSIAARFFNHNNSFHFRLSVAEGNKNAEVVLGELKKKDQKIKSLISSGEKEKALEIKSDMAWKKAFDKVEGRKVSS